MNQELKESTTHRATDTQSRGRGESGERVPNVHLRKSPHSFLSFSPPAATTPNGGAAEPLPDPAKFQQGRSYVAYIPVPIGGDEDDEEDEEEYEEDYEDDEYYEDEEYEYYDEDDEDDYEYEDEDEDVGV